MAITELTRAVAAAGDRDVLGLTGPLPTTRRIERVLFEQLDALPESSRRFLALIAAADDPSLAELVDAALRDLLGDPTADGGEGVGVDRMLAQFPIGRVARMTQGAVSTADIQALLDAANAAR